MSASRRFDDGSYAFREGDRVGMISALIPGRALTGTVTRAPDGALLVEWDGQPFIGTALPNANVYPLPGASS